MAPNLPFKDDGTLQAYAWPGGYPIFYLTEGNCVLCPKCANKEKENIVAADVNYEDDNLFCDECSTQIECAYPPD